MHSLERLTPSINEAIKVTKIDTNHAWLPSKRVAAHLLDMCAASMGPRERGDLTLLPSVMVGHSVLLSCISLVIIYISTLQTARLFLFSKTVLPQTI